MRLLISMDKSHWHGHYSTLSEVVMGSGRGWLAVGAERRLLCERS